MVPDGNVPAPAKLSRHGSVPGMWGVLGGFLRGRGGGDLTALFLLKQRARDNAADLAEALRALPEHQNSWIYVVDMESHELLLINNKTYKITPDSKMGMSCHDITCYKTAEENG